MTKTFACSIYPFRALLNNCLLDMRIPDLENTEGPVGGIVTCGSGATLIQPQAGQEGSASWSTTNPPLVKLNPRATEHRVDALCWPHSWTNQLQILFPKSMVLNFR